MKKEAYYIFTKTLLWAAAIGILCIHGAYLYYVFMPVSTWLNYRSVSPLMDEVCTNEPIKFVSHTDLHSNLILTFNDILYCRDPNSGEFERYNSQNTKRLHSAIGEDRLTVWPFSPGVAYPTECYLESNINIHQPLHIDRSFRYDGLENNKTFTVKECKK